MYEINLEIFLQYNQQLVAGVSLQIEDYFVIF